MDKYEYKLRSEEILNLIEERKYLEAAQIADVIDWRRVKNISMLIQIADLYKINRRNEDCREILILAYDRNPANRSVLNSLCEVSIELDDVVAAIEYYKEFVKLAPRDIGVFTLRYRILEAQEARLEERIELLEELKKRDYLEEWAYELAYLYHRVGLATKCIEECDDLILWFGDGPYVMKALELKMLHAPLTPIQEKKYAQIQGIPVDEEYAENDTNVDSYNEYTDDEHYETQEEYNSEYQEEYQDEYHNSELSEETEETYSNNNEYVAPQPSQSASRAYADMSQYNTINLQKVVAESMRELYPEDEDMYEETRQDIARIEEYERASGNINVPVNDLYDGVAEVAPDSTSGAIRTVFVPDGASESIARNEYAQLGIDYNSDSIQPVQEETTEKVKNDVSEENFRPITGQMNIDEVLHEWERMKKENEEKRKEEIRQHVIQQTGQIFKDFDESINSGILGELKQDEAAINEILPSRVETFIEEDVEEDVLATGRIDLDEAVPVPVQVRQEVSLDCEEDDLEVEDLSAQDIEIENLDKEVVEEINAENRETYQIEKPEYSEEITESEIPVIDTDETESIEIDSSEVESTNTIMDNSMREITFEDDSELGEVEEIEEVEENIEAIEDTEVEETLETYEETEEEEALETYEETEEEEALETYEETEEEEALETYEETEEEETLETYEETEEEETSEIIEDNQEEDLIESDISVEENLLKTKEISMDTAEIGSLSEKIVAATNKETRGSNKESLRDFNEMESDLFDDFAVSKHVKRQIINAIDNMTISSYSGNVIISGEAGVGKLRLAKNLIRVYEKNSSDFSGKVAKITGEHLNIRDIKEIFEKLRNGALIIEDANGMFEKTIYDMTSLLNQEDYKLLIFLTGTKKEITKLLGKQAMMADYFNIRIDLAGMDNNALVEYAQNYALALEYSIDEVARLALHTRIANIQTGSHVVTKDEVREIIDEAIWKSKKSRFKNFIDILISKRYDEDDMIILKERDFM